MDSLTYYRSIILGIAVFVISYFAVFYNIKISRKFNIVDKPKERGIHSKIIPLAGGLSFAIPLIFTNYFISIFLKELNYSKLFLFISIGGVLITLLGFLDDIFKHSAKFKLLFQIIIATGMYFVGFKVNQLTNPFGADILLGSFSFPITIIWYLLLMNALNLIDGLDGLAAGISIIVFITLVLVGLKYENFFLFITALIGIFSVLAFLKFNFHPAEIFMGDTGSLFLGFYIASITIAGGGQYKGIATMTLLIPIIALFIPFSDTLLAITRRVKRKKHIFEADKEHIHHKLLKLGFSQKVVSIIMYFVTFLFALIAYGFSFVEKEILLLTLLVLAILIGIFTYIFWKGDFYK